MEITPYHAKYYSYELTKRVSSNNIDKLTSTLANAQVDLNPHQIEAALFAFKSPLSNGAILADEVGLGKTIEAGLALSQKWAERKRKILLIVPSNLRKQWSSELQEKFFLPSNIIETKSFNDEIKKGNFNPFIVENKILICSYQFARSKSAYLKAIDWDLVVIDEAHRLRNVYKTSNKIAKELKNALEHCPKVLLTATPLQNSLLELYGLVSFIDEHIFGDLKSFKANYGRVSATQEIDPEEINIVDQKSEMFTDLRSRLNTICIRTLRRQVLEYIKYTKRIPITQDYTPTEDETELYNSMSDYLQRPQLYALPSSQRQLMTLILRKLLASSSFAIANTLNGLITRLNSTIDLIETDLSKLNLVEEILEDFEGNDELSEEWDENNDTIPKDKPEYTLEDIEGMKSEVADLTRFKDLAHKIYKNSKGESLITALKKGFETTEGSKKAIIFTESRITQNYLLELLEANGYKDKIVLFNGTNSDTKSKEIYKEWIAENQDSDKVTGSKSSDLRAALVDYFRDTAEIMIATEAAAEGVNLQFCSLVINYDLPWNPQRIEQRIGRCHRYGQKNDVVVINFVNRKNAADQRVYQLLAEKFNLFKGVFGASDEVLGAIESGVDFEKRISSIYQSCRTTDEINLAFDKLQIEMDSTIQEGLKDARQKLLENFDTEVHDKLKSNLLEAKTNLDKFEEWLWMLTKFYLNTNAEFSEESYTFTLKGNPFPELKIDLGPYRIGKHIEDSHIYRPGHPLAELIMEKTKENDLPNAEVIFDYTNSGKLISVLQPFVGKTGILKATNLTIDTLESEDYIIVTAFDNENTLIEDDVAKRIMMLPGVIKSEIVITEEEKTYVKVNEEKYKLNILDLIRDKNSKTFDEEIDKLDKWADDMKKSLEIDLKRLEVEIKSAKTLAKKSLDLEVKIKAQREIKEMEKKRNEKRFKIYESQDQIDSKKDEMLEKIEKQLNQNIETKELFTIRFKIV